MSVSFTLTRLDCVIWCFATSVEVADKSKRNLTLFRHDSPSVFLAGGVLDCPCDNTYLNCSINILSETLNMLYQWPLRGGITLDEREQLCDLACVGG